MKGRMGEERIFEFDLLTIGEYTFGFQPVYKSALPKKQAVRKK